MQQKQNLSMGRVTMENDPRLATGYNEENYEFHQEWYRSLCKRRLELMRSEAFYAKERRHVEKAIILYQVNGKWNGKYIKET